MKRVHLAFRTSKITSLGSSGWKQQWTVSSIVLLTFVIPASRELFRDIYKTDQDKRKRKRAGAEWGDLV